MEPPDQTEPTSPAAIEVWIRAQQERNDPFRSVYARSEEHREQHGAGCDVYATSSGPLLGVLAAATAARRILEIGCGLGYSALWLAKGGGPSSTVETCEKDPVHAALAREAFAECRAAQQVIIHEGHSGDILGELSGPYDLIFADGDTDEYPSEFQHFVRLLRVGGLLVSSNLFLGVYAPDSPALAAASEYRHLLCGDRRLATAFLPGGKALSVRLADG